MLPSSRAQAEGVEALGALIRQATPEQLGAAIRNLTPAAALALHFDWDLRARPEQLSPAGAWRVWMIMAGRGFGKTRSGGECVRKEVDRNPHGRIALIAPTAADARDVMIEGESGLLSLFPPHQRPMYFPSKRQVHFHNGALGTCYSAEEPERLRGPQHSFAWCDEIAVYPKPVELWSNLKFGLRLGEDPRVVTTTTPRPTKFLRELIADAGTVVTRGSTFANRANLPAAVLEEFERVYGGTTVGRQELEGELLEEAQGALWKRATIDMHRVRDGDVPEFVRVVIAVDPSVSSGPNADECGIIPMGLAANGHGFVLADHSGRMAPHVWAAKVPSVFEIHHADRVVAEVNNGGELVENTIRTVQNNIPYEAVHASRGKQTRAEPVAALYEQGKIHHVGVLRELEEEQVNWEPGTGQASPNRMDALVWAASFLMLKRLKIGRVLTV